MSGILSIIACICMVAGFFVAAAGGYAAHASESPKDDRKSDAAFRALFFGAAILVISLVISFYAGVYTPCR